MSIPRISSLKDALAANPNPKKRLVILLFAAWSQVDKFLTSSLERLIPEFEEEIVFLRADVDELVDGYEFLSSVELYTVPTLILFKNGEIVERSVGNVREVELRELLRTWAQK